MGKQGIYLTLVLKCNNYVLKLIKRPLNDRFLREMWIAKNQTFLPWVTEAKMSRTDHGS